MAAIRTLINGNNDSLLSVSDRGLQYGDGLFETVLASKGNPLFLQLHLERLASGCERLAIAFPDRQVLIAEARELTAELDRGVLKIIVTRGMGGRGYRYNREPSVTRILSTHPQPDYPDSLVNTGIRVRVCSSGLGINPSLAGIKHLNRLEQIVARSEWDDAEIFEGLMCDSDGYVVEATMSNLFFVKNKRLCTPDVSFCGVAGVMRSRILGLAEEAGIPVSVFRPELTDIVAADELFLTNSVIEIWPVARLDDREFAVGLITRRLQALVNEQRNAETSLQ